MENIPNVFAIIDARLSLIEELLYQIKHPSRTDVREESALTPARRAMDMSDFCEFVGCSKQHGYRLTSKNQVPFFKRGKKIWFDRDQVQAWLLSDDHRRATTGEAAQQATDFLTSEARRNRNR